MYLVLNPKKRLLSLSYRNTQVDNSAAQTHISVFFGGVGYHNCAHTKLSKQTFTS